MTGPPRLSSDLDALLRRVAGHDQAAFAEFYDHTKSRVYGLVMRVLRDTGYSEETTQEIYLEVWRNASEFDSAKGSALAWLFDHGPPARCRPSPLRASRQPAGSALWCGQRRSRE